MSWRSRIVGHDRVDPQSLTGHPLNHRLHPQKQRDVVRDSIAQFGFCKSILVNRQTGYIIDGHERVWQALDAQESDPTVTVDVEYVDLSEDEERAVLAVLDASTEMAEVDQDKLDALLDGIAFESDAIDELIDTLKDDRRVEVVEDGDSVPEVPVEPVTKPGDLWLLGNHRLLCGDATSADDVARLMDEAKAECVFTDPPYGVSIGAKNRFLNSVQKAGLCLENITGDDLTPEQLKQMLLPAFVNIRTMVMAEDCTLFVCAPQGGELGMMMMMMQDAGLRARHVLIWKKNQPTFSMGRLDYDYQHEPILLTWGKKHKRPMKGSCKTSVWEIDRERTCDLHPTMKPVALYANAYLNNSDDASNVFDAYSGSGTAFIAAEQLGRKCHGMELSPQYCDIIVERWENLTGEKAICQPKT